MTETATLTDLEAARLADIADTLVLPYLNHAVSMLEEGYASREDIDNGMRYGCGLPAGPFALIDGKGAEAVEAALADRFAATGDPLHEPRPLLRTLGTGGADATEAASDAGAVALRSVARVGVVGTGTMATGIVEVFAKAGYEVVAVGRSDDKTAAVIATITRNQAKLVEKGRTTQADADALLARVSTATERDALADVDLVVEAIAEDLDIKQELFRDLDRICKPGAILATTTSSMPIAECAAVTNRPQDVVGMHFFNPATIMKLVEIVRTDDTAGDVLATVKDLCDRTGKVAVSCSDRSGFIVNALLFPYLNDAVKLVESGAATVEEVDEAIKSTYEYPMGPFALLDVVGLDVSLAIQRELVAEFGHEGWAPAATLVALVEKGELGRKTGKGFLAYA